MRDREPLDYSRHGDYKPMNVGQALVVVACCVIAIVWIVGALIARGAV